MLGEFRDSLAAGELVNCRELCPKKDDVLMQWGGGGGAASRFSQFPLRPRGVMISLWCGSFLPIVLK